MKTFLSSLVLAAGAAAFLAPVAAAAEPSVHAGRASVYRQLPERSLERVSTPEHIMTVATVPTAPTEIWRTLEHGERVECLRCIPEVSKLLWDAHPKTREIAAWWLRRRIFGVFGPGEIYSRVVDTLNGGASEVRRAHAAEALGEFLVRAGVPHVARAAVSDGSAVVRRSAVKALERLNSEGPAGELSQAFADGDEAVRLAAVRAVPRINVFSRVDLLVARLGDASAEVRRAAAESLGALRAEDAVVALVALASPDREESPDVRAAAVAALGWIGDRSARGAVEGALGDSDPIVASAAAIAARQL